MQRRPWFELHDHRFFPRLLRDLVTDALEAVWNAQDTYGPIVPRLQQALWEAGTSRVVDLCSGGGGPWQRLSRDFAEQGARSGVRRPEVCLTDIYPNRRAFERLRREAAVDFCAEAVNAMRIPRELAGFRTIFSSFHHFAPDEARAILKDAFDARQGIAVFEGATREPRTLMAIFFLMPLLTLLLMPRIRPFRWSRLFYTYLLPVIPFTLWMDGLLSCLRSYSQSDLRELVSGMTAEDYRWDVGIERGRLVAVAYLIGHPLRRGWTEAAEEAAVLTADGVEMRTPA
jgi:SAM-dependent methyltransferase